MGDLRVAAIQMDCRAGDVEANLAHATELVEQAAAQGAQLIVLPEMFNTGYEYTDRNDTLTEPLDTPEKSGSLPRPRGKDRPRDGGLERFPRSRLDGRTATWLTETARRLGVHLVGGFPARIAGQAYIVALLAAPDGRRWVYRKVHVSVWENLYFASGDEPLIAETDLGRIGLFVCWDEVFADLARAYQGRVDLLCVPSSPPTFIGQVEDAEGRALTGVKTPRFLGQEVDAVDWFRRAQETHARSAGVPLIYAARCGTFHSPLPYGWPFLMTLGLRDAWRVLRAAGSRYYFRGPIMGRSCILDAQGKRLVQAGESDEAVLVATVQPGALDPATLPPLPKGRALVPGIPCWQFLFDDWLILLGRWVRRRRRR